MSCSDLQKLPLPDRIRTARRDAGLSQKALGEAIGTTYRHVLDWEKGRYGPSLDYATRLSEVLGCEPGVWRGEGHGAIQRAEASLEAALAETNELLAEIRDLLARPELRQDDS